MSNYKLNTVVKLSKFMVYLIIQLFVSSYFSLDIPIEVLLKELICRLPIAIFASFILVWFEGYWMKGSDAALSEEER